MSTINVTIERIKSILPHPNADRLEIAQVLGTQIVIPKGMFQEGSRCVFFPPGILIHPAEADALGVTKYLKHSDYEYDGFSHGSTQCRVAAARLRGVPSYGFVAPFPGVFEALDVGTDVSAAYRAYKFEPPPQETNGEPAPGHPQFHRYTDIENLYRFPDVLQVGEPVRITEKIHGRNNRVGLIRISDGEFEFMAGSRRRIIHQPQEGTFSRYWQPLEQAGVLNLLTHLCDEQHSVILFGELFGPGMQDLDYGVPLGDVGYRVFDISIDGVYQDWDVVRTNCDRFNVAHVPLIYEGSFSQQVVEEFTDGPTFVGIPVAKFKGREGIVITPLKERWDHGLGRVILKSVSVDYLDRKDAQDNE